MKITNRNILWYLFFIANIIYVTTLFLSLSEEYYIISGTVIGILWAAVLLFLLIAMINGDIEFEIDLFPSISRWKEKAALRKEIDDEIIKLKKIAVNKIDDQKSFEKIIGKIATLEEQKQNI